MGKIIEIGNTIRIEDGPARRKTIATAEVLDNRITAKHYQEGKSDAMGKKIVLGEDMTYLDYYGNRVFYIYGLGEVGIDKDDVIILPGDDSGREAVRTEERWLPVGVEDTQEKAQAVAAGLAGGE